MPFQPQSKLWPGNRAVLLVHGIGDASTGRDGAFPLHTVEKVLGGGPSSAAIYRVNYDFINDWLSTKVQLEAGVRALKAQIKSNLGSDDLDATIADYAGDVLWPILSASHRFAVRDAIIAQLQQMVVDRHQSARRAHADPLDYQISIIAHSLGCFHTYEVLASIAQEPTHRLQPVTDLFSLKSVILMASPVQLIRTVAGGIGTLVPDKANLATLAQPLAIPSEMDRGNAVPSTADFVSITGTHDPVGGHLIGRKLDWAYMNIPGQRSIIVPQQFLDIDTKDGTAKALATAFATGGPQVNDPHSWSAYIEHEADLLRGALLA